MSRLSSILKFVLVLTLGLFLFSCRKELNLEQTVSNGSFIQSVNGKKLTCKVERTAIGAGQDIILICTNETDYNATINVMVNDQKVGTIDSFPAEFHHTINDAGVYQFSISGTLNSKNIFEKMSTTFSFGWSISVSK